MLKQFGRMGRHSGDRRRSQLGAHWKGELPQQDRAGVRRKSRLRAPQVDGVAFRAIRASFDEAFVAPGRLIILIGVLEEQHAELVAGASALVSLYGDEATTPCLEYAAASGAPCAVVPCNECAGGPGGGCAMGSLGAAARLLRCASSRRTRGTTRPTRRPDAKHGTFSGPRRCFSRRRTEVEGLERMSPAVLAGSSVRCCSARPSPKCSWCNCPTHPKGCARGSNWSCGRHRCRTGRCSANRHRIRCRSAAEHRCSRSKWSLKRCRHARERLEVEGWK